MKRKWWSSKWVEKQWIRMYYTTGNHQYLFIMSVWEINLLADLYSLQLIPLFQPELLCFSLSATQLLNGAIKYSEVMVSWRQGNTAMHHTNPEITKWRVFRCHSNIWYFFIFLQMVFIWYSQGSWLIMGKPLYQPVPELVILQLIRWLNTCLTLHVWSCCFDWWWPMFPKEDTD